jgi:organic radical activating enzyme
MECDIVDICNLKCKYCSHLASEYKTNIYSFEEYKNDIVTLSKVLRCEVFCLLGGEPLILGNKLSDYVDVLKESGITKHVRIFTNGILMEKCAEVLYKFDSICVSLYPNKHKEDILKWIKEHRNEYIKIEVNLKSYFSKFFTENILEENRAKMSWETCKAKIECNTVYKGKYYRCIQSPKFHYKLDKMNICNIHHDGCDLYQDNLEIELKKYIDNNTQLSTCSYCLSGLDRFLWEETGYFHVTP